LALDSNNVEALVTVGNAFLDEQDVQQASDYFTKAVNVSPESGRAWSGLGLTDMLKSDLPKAIDDLKKAVTYMPSHLGTWHTLAWAQLCSNDIQGARETLEKAMDIDRNFGETHGGLAVIDIMENNRESAKERIKRATRLDSVSFSARFAQSLLIQDSDPKQAQSIIQDIMSYQFGGGKTLQDILTKAIKQRNPH
jgi:Tfp pilus assembly protein PilF